MGSNDTLLRPWVKAQVGGGISRSEKRHRLSMKLGFPSSLASSHHWKPHRRVEREDQGPQALDEELGPGVSLLLDFQTLLGLRELGTEFSL